MWFQLDDDHNDDSKEPERHSKQDRKSNTKTAYEGLDPTAKVYYNEFLSAAQLTRTKSVFVCGCFFCQRPASQKECVFCFWSRCGDPTSFASHSIQSRAKSLLDREFGLDVSPSAEPWLSWDGRYVWATHIVHCPWGHLDLYDDTVCRDMVKQKMPRSPLLARTLYDAASCSFEAFQHGVDLADMLYDESIKTDRRHMIRQLLLLQQGPMKLWRKCFVCGADKSSNKACPTCQRIHFCSVQCMLDGLLVHNLFCTLYLGLCATKNVFPEQWNTVLFYRRLACTESGYSSFRKKRGRAFIDHNKQQRQIVMRRWIACGKEVAKKFQRNTSKS